MNKPAQVDSRLRAIRKERGHTQEALAERVGCDQTTISDIEVGRAHPSLKLALALADVLGTTVDDLFAASEVA